MCDEDTKMKILWRMQVLQELDLQDQKIQVCHETCFRLSLIIFGKHNENKFVVFVFVVIELV